MVTMFAEFAIYGSELDPQLITELAGIKPDSSWRPGDIKNRRTNAVHDEGCWKIHSEENSSALEEHVRILMERISQCGDLFQTLRMEQSLQFEIAAVVRIGDESPDISLSGELISWLASFGAGLGIDLYLQ